MKLTPRTVLVLGAGFTRAFLPEAPLLTDDYDGNRLADRFASMATASRVLELERTRNPDRMINLERLMTRLDGGMPYDAGFGVREELGLLLAELKQGFIRQIQEAKAEVAHADLLKTLASIVVENTVNSITFNYDDVFDKALWEVRAVLGDEEESGGYWHPDRGYGFFCKPAVSTIQETGVFMDMTPFHLLKLHGSMNWRPKRGSLRPYAIDAVVHHEDWLPLAPSLSQFGLAPELMDAGTREIFQKRIELHLEADPFIVPPVLAKSALVEQPILRLIWALAHEAMRQAEQVVFVGYSLPRTDLAASFLFREAMSSDARVTVVNVPETMREVESTSRDLFGTSREIEFDNGGALGWARRVAKAHEPQVPPQPAEGSTEAAK
jgi:hypothetical protein